MPVKKADVPRPSLPKETVAVAELGGDVVVQGLLLKDRLELSGAEGFSRMSFLLSKAVVDADGAPIYTADEWEVFGGQHEDATFKLFDTAMRLSGFGGEQKKNATPS